MTRPNWLPHCSRRASWRAGPDPPSAAPTDSDGGLNPAPHEVFPMSKVLIVAEHLDGKLNASTAKCVSAAQALSPEAIDIVVLAAAPAAVAADAAPVDGLPNVLTVANEANPTANTHVPPPQVANLAEA